MESLNINVLYCVVKCLTNVEWVNLQCCSKLLRRLVTTSECRDFINSTISLYRPVVRRVDITTITETYPSLKGAADDFCNEYNEYSTLHGRAAINYAEVTETIDELTNDLAEEDLFVLVLNEHSSIFTLGSNYPWKRHEFGPHLPFQDCDEYADRYANTYGYLTEIEWNSYRDQWCGSLEVYRYKDTWQLSISHDNRHQVSFKYRGVKYCVTGYLVEHMTLDNWVSNLGKPLHVIQMEGRMMVFPS